MTETRAGSLPGRPAVKLGRALASPVGVLITIPLLVVVVGVGVMLLGREATRSSSRTMAEKQLTEQASSIQGDVAFALDQASPILERLRVLADPARPLEDVLVRVHDLIVGRPGVSYASISFSDGTFRGAYLGEGRRVEVQESRIGTRGTEVVRFTVKGGALEKLREEVTDYDPRRRGFYQLAERTRARAWTEPYTFFRSHETGITCTEPVYDATNQLVAVLTVDFDVGALSTFVARPALDEARTLVTTRDGVILAYPAADKLALPANDKLLRYADLRIPPSMRCSGSSRSRHSVRRSRSSISRPATARTWLRSLRSEARAPGSPSRSIGTSRRSSPPARSSARPTRSSARA